jgi:hypothetical protein
MRLASAHDALRIILSLYIVCFLFCLFVLVELGFELSTSHLQSRHSIVQATPPVRFSLVILEMGSCKLFG